MSDLPENFKIMVPDEFSDEIQRKLFSLGKCWNGGATDIIKLSTNFMLVENDIFRGSLREDAGYFLELDVPEITLTQLMNAKPPSLSKKHIGDLGDSLKSLSQLIKKVEDEFKNIFYK